MLEHSYQLRNAPDELSMSFVKVDSYLRDQRICYGKLGQSIAGNGELADADNTKPELG